MSTQTVTEATVVRYYKTIGVTSNAVSGRGFVNPYDVAFTRDNRMFYLNRCDYNLKRAIRIGICNQDDEEFLGEFGNGYGSGDGQFVWPVAMAFDAGERLHVTDEQNDRISVFDSSGSHITTWGTSGAGAGQFRGPAGIAIDDRDNVYVVDQHNSRIQKLTADGEFVAQWGEKGSGPGQFNLPWGVTVDSHGDVFVADWRNDRIQKFGPDGRFLASFGESGQGEGQFHRPSGVAVDAQGNIYVSDWGNERVQVLGPDGAFKQLMRGEATLSRWAREWLEANEDERTARDKANLVPDQLPSHLQTPYHISSQTEPFFWGPVSVKLDYLDRLYVTECNRHRVQVYERI